MTSSPVGRCNENVAGSIVIGSESGEQLLAALQSLAVTVYGLLGKVNLSKLKLIAPFPPMHDDVAGPQVRSSIPSTVMITNVPFGSSLSLVSVCANIDVMNNIDNVAIKILMIVYPFCFCV